MELQDKKIKKLLHTLAHTVEHFEDLIKSIEDCGLNSGEYTKLKEKLKQENEKLKEKLK
ncbi:hypothetical protein [Methanococcus aeolicus]|uniref:Uncharacterized protein n=1 Tax=Methanococcus aeolicus (strain ATCC BAA-1280 / DSM 17508 / OCM 812 / Nankai-3) TaxID=419665 RepID=A6UWN0_META3|nr:hypothetical protein [Methanococcus aeolicus]ABR56902.1 hypothetical protein Maeo_1326 [Methanococcus aeolicus Nankai-3]UXM84900.1 hypothetical protein N6C89_01070 [Methanococcus aeolicus]